MPVQLGSLTPALTAPGQPARADAIGLHGVGPIIGGRVAIDDCNCRTAQLHLEPLSGRRAEAARNDLVIREAFRAVFTAKPDAPTSTVAERASVGISALYRRYRSKDELLQRLSLDGLSAYVADVEAALADGGDPLEPFAQFIRRCVGTRRLPDSSYLR